MSIKQPYAIPKDGFISTGFGANYQLVSGSLIHNVGNTDGMTPGTQISYKNAELNAFGTCTYLKFEQGAAAEDLIAGSLVGLDKTSEADTADDFFTVTGDVSETNEGPWAISLNIWATGDDGNWGFFWTNGVCPDLTTLVGSTETRLSAVNAVTDGNLADGSIIAPHSTNEQLAVHTSGTTVTLPVGFTRAADSTNDLALKNIFLTNNWG